MCFYNDYADWSADVFEVTCHRPEVRPLDEEGCLVQCCECSRWIEPGEWRVSTWMQEHEECQICEDESSYDYDESIGAAECDHDYGESWGGETCVDCARMLAAVYEVEAAEGCPEYSRQPISGDLWDSLEQFDAGEREKYSAAAIARWPYLATNQRVAELLGAGA